MSRKSRAGMASLSTRRETLKEARQEAGAVQAAANGKETGKETGKDTERYEALLTAFEWSLWRISSAFMRWQEECSNEISNAPLGGHDTAVLHTIRHRGKPKGLSEISRLLGRDDTANVQYSIKKLLTLELIERVGGLSRKETMYQVSAQGLALTQEYRALRRTLLVSMVRRLDKADDNLKSAADTMELLTGFYESASRRVTSGRFGDAFKKQTHSAT